MTTFGTWNRSEVLRFSSLPLVLREQGAVPRLALIHGREET